ncbi:MAG: type 4a pilus biogenesis protein PilO [Candidatus Neomarinimicrobiota bacterium]
MSSKPIYYLLFMLAMFITGWWLWTVVWVDRTEYNDLTVNLAESDLRLEQLNIERSNYSVVKTQHEMKTHDFDTLKTHIPVKAKGAGSSNYVNMLQSIRQLAESRGIEIISFAPQIDNSYPNIHTQMKLANHHVERHKVSLTGRGDYLSFGAFLEDLRNNDEFVNVSKFSIDTDFHGSGRLVCDAILLTYMYLEN